MIVLDTHIWVWWVDESPQLSERHTQLLQDNEQSGLGVSAISCWEVAKLVESELRVAPAGDVIDRDGDQTLDDRRPLSDQPRQAMTGQ